MVVAVGEIVMFVVVVVVGGKIVVVEVVDESYLMNDLAHFDMYHRLDLDHRS